MKKFAIKLTFSIILLILGFLHVPIMAMFGIDVFALRGVLIFTAIPIVAVCSIPFAYLMVKKFDNKN